ncbi:MAG: galactose mutarotase [Firmicutes bacterium]|nr:galactose mutarotase [Bacillota bacterium]
MKKSPLGALPDGRVAQLYEISSDCVTAVVSDLGANLVRLLVPGRDGSRADVVLGFDDPAGYLDPSGGSVGAVVGRNANRVALARFSIGGETVQLARNEGENNLHSGPAYYYFRLWEVEQHTRERIVLRLDSPDGDQGFPGNATVRVTYRIEGDSLHLIYDGISDRDTVFNMTNHSYFNLCGHDKPEKAMSQLLCIPGERFAVADAASIPTGELRPVANTPMDFRKPKPIGRDIDQPYEPLLLQGGYDHSFEAAQPVCAVLSDPASGRMMTVSTTCPAVQLYAANFLNPTTGKDGARYDRRGAVCLETQFHPDTVHHPDWPQSIVKAGEPYHSETVFRFTVQ